MQNVSFYVKAVHGLNENDLITRPRRFGCVSYHLRFRVRNLGILLGELRSMAGQAAFDCCPITSLSCLPHISARGEVW